MSLIRGHVAITPPTHTHLHAYYPSQHEILEGNILQSEVIIFGDYLYNREMLLAVLWSVYLLESAAVGWTSDQENKEDLAQA